MNFSSSSNIDINNNNVNSSQISLSALATSFIPTNSILTQIETQMQRFNFNDFITYSALPSSQISSSLSSNSSSSASSTTSYMSSMLPPPPSSLPLTSHNKFQTTKRTKLFVGNLSSDTTLKELIALFSQYGLVNEKLCVVKDDNYAFIHFFNEKEADLACKALNDSFFKNRYIRVQYSTSQGHIKKTPAPASLGVTRSSSAFCFNTSVSQMTDSLLLGLNDQQCKSNLLIPASLLKSIESLNEQQNLNQQHVFKQRNTLATSQSMQSFTISGKNPDQGCIGYGRPILKAKFNPF